MVHRFYRSRVALLVAGCWAGAALGASWASESNAFGADVVTQCISANEDSLTLRKQGRLLDARRALAGCAATMCPDAIQRACRSRMTDFNNAIPSVVFDVRDAQGRDIVDVRVSVDGQPMVPVPLTATALDPGPHVFRFGAPGQSSVESTIVLREGEKDQRVAVVLGGSATLPVGTPLASDEGRAAVPGTPSSSSATGRAAETPTGGGAESGAITPSSQAGSVQRTVGWIVGGTGLAVLVTSAVLAPIEYNWYHSVDSSCRQNMCLTPAAQQTRNSAVGLGNIDTGFAVAGSVLTAAGVVLWITAPRAPKVGGAPSWRAGFTLGGAMAEGEF